MSTKKLQIVTPIVTSVNGKTGDVTLETVDLDELQASLDNKVPTSRKINGYALSADIELSAEDVSADPSGTAVAEIGKLDVTEIGGTGEYIQSVQQTDGKISATAGTMPTALKNPEALSITKYGANGRNEFASYDGSAAQSIKIYEPTEKLVTTGSGADNPPKSKTVKEALDGKISKSGDNTFTGTLIYLGTDESAINLGGDGGIGSAKSFQFSGPLDKIDITPLSDVRGLKLISNNADIVISGIATPTSNNHAVNKAYADGKISKAGDTFTGELVYSNSGLDYSDAIDLGKNGCINNAKDIAFYYDANGEDRGFHITATSPATDGYYASAQFWGNDGDELVRVDGIAPPKSDTNAANKAYVDEKVKYLTTDLYGTTLPTTATAGQIFFKKL